MLCMEDIEEGIEGYDDEGSLLMSQKSLEKHFGQSPVFIAATVMEQGGIPPTTNPASLLKEAIQVISYGYEDKTEWGKEIGWIYGFVTEDILTGFKMNARGWRTLTLLSTHLPPSLLTARFLLFAFLLGNSSFRRWIGVSVEDLWRNEQFWVIGGTSAHLFAVFQGFLKCLLGLIPILLSLQRLLMRMEILQSYMYSNGHLFSSLQLQSS